jgi:hypothetical protein
MTTGSPCLCEHTEFSNTNPAVAQRNDATVRVSGDGLTSITRRAPPPRDGQRQLAQRRGPPPPSPSRPLPTLLPKIQDDGDVVVFIWFRRASYIRY